MPNKSPRRSKPCALCKTRAEDGSGSPFGLPSGPKLWSTILNAYSIAKKIVKTYN